MKYWVVFVAVLATLAVSCVLAACGTNEPVSGSDPKVLLSGKHMFFWPDVSGEIIVWMDDRNGDPENPLSNPDVFGYDLAKRGEVPICTLGSRQLYPRVSDRLVVWSDYRNVAKAKVGTLKADPDIYASDLRTGHELAVCTAKGAQLYADVSGDLIVWADWRNPRTAPDIYAYDVAKKKEFPVVIAPGVQRGPSISGRRVAWADYGSTSEKALASGAVADVFFKDLDTGRVSRVSKPGRSGNYVQIDGETVIWADTSAEGTKRGFYVRDLDSRKVAFIHVDGLVMGRFALSGHRVIWAEEGQGLTLGPKSTNVRGYNVNDGSRFLVAQNTGAGFATLSGDEAVWQDFDADAPEFDVNQLVMCRIQ